MRACESAKAGNASSAQAATVKRTILNLECESLDMATPGVCLCLLEHGSGAGVVKLGSKGHFRRAAAEGLLVL